MKCRHLDFPVPAASSPIAQILVRCITIPFLLAVPVAACLARRKPGRVNTQRTNKANYVAILWFKIGDLTPVLWQTVQETASPHCLGTKQQHELVEELIR